jgi:hypothetical protein
LASFLARTAFFPALAARAVLSGLSVVAGSAVFTGCTVVALASFLARTALFPTFAPRAIFAQWAFALRRGRIGIVIRGGSFARSGLAACGSSATASLGGTRFRRAVRRRRRRRRTAFAELLNGFEEFGLAQVARFGNAQ